MTKQRVHTAPKPESQGVHTCDAPHNQLHSCREGEVPGTHEGGAEEEDEWRAYHLRQKVCWREVVRRYAVVGARCDRSEQRYVQVHQYLRVVAPHNAAEPLGAVDKFKGGMIPGLESSGPGLCCVLAHKYSAML